MNKQGATKRNMVQKPKKQQKRNIKKIQKMPKRKMTDGRAVPGGSAAFLSPTDRSSLVLEAQHSRDITALQTYEDVNLNSRIISPNTYIPKMVLSGDLPQAQAHTRAFYRKILRMLPALTVQYSMHELHPRLLVPVIRSHFEKHGKVTSPQIVDALRWEAEVEFSDIVRMFYTQTNTFSTLFPDLHYAMLPKLPSAAAPKGYDPVLTQLEHNSSTFLEDFLDPMAGQRKLREERAVPFHHI
jgi:hypothetical protein